MSVADRHAIGTEILLIEDSHDDAQLALHAFGRRGLRDRVLVVRDGQSAVDRLLPRAGPVDGDAPLRPRLVLLDLKLPTLSGLDVLRLLKSADGTRHIPVVVLTSSREARDIDAAHRLGANAYLVKPVDFDAFQRMIGLLVDFWLGCNVTDHASPTAPEALHG
jgi:CheY-like chemotaxis protein